MERPRPKMATACGCVTIRLTRKAYLGQSTHLVYLGTSFKESLDADTYNKGKGSTVARVVDGSLEGHSISGMVSVANIGTDSTWCGNQFHPANWYADQNESIYLNIDGAVVLCNGLVKWKSGWRMADFRRTG
jgi:alpha-glucuronidase